MLATRFDLPVNALLAALGTARATVLAVDVAAYHDAARLIGAADAIRDRNGYGYGDWWERAMAECRAALDAELGPRRAAVLIAAGRERSPASILG